MHEIEINNGAMIGGSVNVTNHIVERAKTAEELLQERKGIFRRACKRAYEDLLLTDAELSELEDLRQSLGLEKDTADDILDSVRKLAANAVLAAPLTGIAGIKVKQFSDAILRNDIMSLTRMMDSIMNIAETRSNDDLQYKYYLVLSVLNPEKCIQEYENTVVDNYWMCFWTYLALVNSNRLKESEALLHEIGDKFTRYPEDNLTLLAAAGILIQKGVEASKEYFFDLGGDISPMLQRFMDAFVSKLFPDKTDRLGDRKAYEFYADNVLKIWSEEDQKKNRIETLKRKEEGKKSEARARLVEQLKKEARFQISDDGKVLIECLDKQIKSCDIPLCVVSIGKNAFLNCRKLSRICLHSNIKNIGDCAFEGCRSLRKIIIPSSVSTIGDCAFKDCHSLMAITIPSSVSSLGNKVFTNCRSLRRLSVPTVLSSHDVDGCGRIERIILPRKYKASFDVEAYGFHVEFE